MKTTVPALVLLILLLGLCLRTGETVAQDARQWTQELEQADAMIREERWAEAQTALEVSYRHWNARQSALRVILPHSNLEEVECLYRRVIAFASVQDPGELLADLSALIRQLELLAIREQPTLPNVL